MTPHASASMPAAVLRAMPLHAVTEIHGEPGLRRRLTLDLDALPEAGRAVVAKAAGWAAHLHAGQRPNRETYVNHALRVTLRMLCPSPETTPALFTTLFRSSEHSGRPCALPGRTDQRYPPPRGPALAAVDAR